VRNTALEQRQLSIVTKGQACVDVETTAHAIRAKLFSQFQNGEDTH